MKAYTDLEQSKKLAEILPFKSADMYYYTINGHSEWYKTPNILENIDDLDMDGNSIPCWSLAALLNVLCSNANDVRMGGTIWYWWCQPLFSDPAKYIKNIGGNELVNVCCEIIFKLKELNILYV